MKNDEISIRIKQIKTKLCNSNNREFAQKLGITEQYASNICNGTKSIGDSVIDKLLTAFPEVRRAWLIVGEGEMLQDNSKQNTQIGENKGIIVQHGGGGDTYNNNAELMQVVLSQQKTIQELTETNRQQSDQIGQLIRMLKEK